MKNRKIFSLDEYVDAGSWDLVELQGPPGTTNMVMDKHTVDILFTALFITGQNVHLSGSSGCGKTTFLQSLLTPGRNHNIRLLCRAFGIPEVAAETFSFPVAAIDASSELYRIRSISAERGTYFEDSELWQWITKVDAAAMENTVVIGWIREYGRAAHPSIENALVDLIADGPLQHPDGRCCLNAGRRITWVMDSNMAALNAPMLNPPDPAMLRRFPVQYTLSHPAPYVEKAIIEHLLADEGVPVKEAEIDSLIKLGARIRELQNDGQLLSVATPGIPTYLHILRLASRLPAFAFHDIITCTILGNCKETDQLPLILNEVFGRNHRQPSIPVGHGL